MHKDLGKQCVFLGLESVLLFGQSHKGSQRIAAVGVASGQDAFHAVSCPQEMLQRKTEETSNSLSISDLTVTPGLSFAL